MRFDPASWHDYFIVVGGGAAALTGLVFVAMSLHLDQIALNVAHRHRARTVLTGLTAVFIRCSLVLMAAQSAQAVALELILVLLVVEAILFLSIRQALRSSEVPDRALLWRTIGSFSCLVVEQIGAAVLFTGDARGLYAIGIGTNGMAPFPIMDGATGRVLTDAEGNVLYQRIPVSFNEVGLKEVAQIAGGQFYRASDTKSLESIFRDIDKLEKSTVSVKKYQQYRDLFPVCIMSGVGLLIGQVLLSQTLWKKLP